MTTPFSPPSANSEPLRRQTRGAFGTSDCFWGWDVAGENIPADKQPRIAPFRRGCPERRSRGNTPAHGRPPAGSNEVPASRPSRADATKERIPNEAANRRHAPSRDSKIRLEQLKSRDFHKTPPGTSRARPSTGPRKGRSRECRCPAPFVPAPGRRSSFARQPKPAAPAGAGWADGLRIPCKAGFARGGLR